MYRLSRKARAKVEMRGFDQISKEIAIRTEKRNPGDSLEIDSRVELVGVALVSTRKCYATNGEAPKALLSPFAVGI